MLNQVRMLLETPFSVCWTPNIPTWGIALGKTSKTGFIRINVCKGPWPYCGSPLVQAPSMPIFTKAGPPQPH